MYTEKISERGDPIGYDSTFNVLISSGINFAIEDRHDFEICRFIVFIDALFRFFIFCLWAT